MQQHTLQGGGGISLNVFECGNPQGKPIFFIHGFSQSGLCFRKQLNSGLARDFRLVAIDNRGHGNSDKPRDVYGDSRLWADDIKAVITGLNLDEPILSGWSYGGVIILDYIKYHGEDEIAGVNFIGACSKLGEPVFPYLGQDFVALIPGFNSNDVIESAETLQKFMRLVVAETPSDEDFYYALGYNAIVPPYVREALFARSLDNDDLLSNLKKPLLLSHGDADAIVLYSMAEHHAQLAPQAQLSRYEGMGHAPFMEDPERFNREIREFRESC